jgi:glucose/arabinose dehydrogenase
MSATAKLIASGLNRPVFATAPLGNTNRLFIIEQRGRIRILDLSANPPLLKPVPFLALQGLATGNEQGLLGLAFHPEYATNGFFYVNFTDATGTTNIKRFKVTANPDVADPNTSLTLLTVQQPFANHNGGWIAFGPDKMLYIGMGDGGSGNDPGKRAQNLQELLGKMLRIDVNGDDFPDDPNRNYRIPPDNPFVNTPNARPEIWAYGLRNPWRCSFDRQTGDLYIADVGQDQFEEINLQKAANKGGENYGWRIKEGLHDTGLDPAGGHTLVDPIHEYDHGVGIAIVGGYVYRGSAIDDLKGAYLFADFTGPIWSLRHDGTKIIELTPREGELFPNGGPSSISSFGEDAAGELYLVNLMPGQVFRLEKQPSLAMAGPKLLGAGPHLTGHRGRFHSLQWSHPTRRPGVRAAVSESREPLERAVSAIGFPEVTGVEPVVEARLLLQAAAEVEHALLVQYLYAMYSLDASSDSTARSWMFAIRDIAKEEMGHLMTVQNLLLAIGGEISFDRITATIPSEAAWDPFPFKLEPLTLPALAKYVTAESPLPEQLPPEVRPRAETAFGLARLAVAPPQAPPAAGLNHVGVLYARLYWLFQPNETPQGPWQLPRGIFPDRHLQPTDFVPDPDRQADPNESGGTPEEQHFNGMVYVRMIGGVTDAFAALYFIATQGEGWVMAPTLESHFERFLTIFEQYLRHLGSGAEPVLPIPTNPHLADQPVPDFAAERNRITHPSAMRWAKLFNARYQMLIAELWLAMLLPRSNSKRGDLFSHAIYTEMKRSVRDLAKKLVTLPRKNQPTGSDALKLAGPPFELPENDWPTDVVGLQAFIRDHIALAGQLMSWLESPENSIPPTPQDKSLFNVLRNADVTLLSALEP